jgi:hypothetical protein
VARNRTTKGEIKRKTKLKFYEVLTVPSYCRETGHRLRRIKFFSVAVEG